MSELIRGAGVGGGQRKPKTKPDNLDSKQYAQLIDLISEGEIQGLKDGSKSIFVNNTPLQNPDKTGTYSQADTTITVQLTNHGYTVNQLIAFNATSGAGIDGDYVVLEVLTVSSFTLKAADSQTTAGNCTTASYNFDNLEVYTRNGTQNQAIIPLNVGIENEIPVGITVLKDFPVTRTISDPTIDAARITITIPSLQRYKNNGDLVGTTLQLDIAVQYAGGGFTSVVLDTITGRTGDAYQKDYRIELNGPKPVDVRVTRITPDSADTKLTNAFAWTGYTEIVDTKLRYPNSALVGFRIDSEQFSSIPQRSYQVRGIKVQIPNSATVDQTTGALIYAGVWGGTFGAAQWCSDPAWILWDLLTSARYGFGDHIQAALLDKWSFYAASQYASALNTYTDAAEIADRAARGLPPRTGATNDYNATTGKHGVPDGFGGYEPRFSCNVNIQTQEDAYKLINDMCSVFRAMPYWSTGALTVSQDAPRDPSYLFTLANVSEAGFTYQSSAQKIRPTVALVSYLDLTTREIVYEAVEDQEAIAKYGVVTTQISAFACTSRGQAARMGEWLLYAEQYESEVISFTTSLDAGVIVRPGQIIEVADPMRAGSRRGGRISAATSTDVTVDDATGLPSSGGAVSVILPDGTVEQKTMSSRTGTVLTVSSAFSVAPNANSIWVYQSNELQASTWRVLAVQEQDGNNYVVNALAYDASKYDYIERQRELQPRDITNFDDPPAAPTNLLLNEELYLYQDQVRAKIIISWQSVLGVNQYQVRWRKDQGNWSTVDVYGPDYEILDITPGFFEFEIYSVSPNFKLSTGALAGNITALGKTAPPSSVTGFSYVLDSSIGVTLTWNPVADIDLSDYEIRRGVDWNSGTLVTRVKASSYKIGYLDDGTYTYFIRARDTSDVYSETPVSTSITVVPPGPPAVTHQVLGESAVIQWTATSGSYLPSYYEVRYGASFAAGASLGQFKTTSINVPITWIGSRTFWVAAVDPVGNIGTAASTVVQNVPATAPTITYAFGSDSVRLTWNEVNGITRTKMYEIRRGATFSTATAISTIQATAFSLKVDWVGAQTFWVVALDSNGNLGTEGSVVVTVAAAGAPTVDDVFSGDQAILSWQAVKGSLDTAFYQIRRGLTYGTAPIIGTIQGTTYSVKVNWAQTERFWVNAVDVAGNLGTSDSIDIIVPPPTQPTITPQVVDNNVLLRWNDTTTVLPIVYYELRRGSTYATATVIGTKQGLFTSVFETVSGNFTYWLAGVDSGGNVGTPGSINTTVSQPPDYVLQLDQDSTFSGTKTNVLAQDGNLYATVDTTETWQSHFTSRGWSTPQDQINAGFNVYALPSTTSGSYEEIIDYGAVLPSSKISLTLTAQSITGSVTVTPQISVRKLVTDPWIVYNNTTEVYVTDFRYIRIRYDFASSGGDDLLLITNINVRLDVKNKTDGGGGTANSGDVGGTTTNFNVAFTDVQSITVTPSGTTPRLAIYDFVDAPNPTGFKVLLFDTSGNRVTGSFSWSAKGV